MNSVVLPSVCIPTTPRKCPESEESVAARTTSPSQLNQAKDEPSIPCQGKQEDSARKAPDGRVVPKAYCRDTSVTFSRVLRAPSVPSPASSLPNAQQTEIEQWRGDEAVQGKSPPRVHQRHKGERKQHTQSARQDEKRHDKGTSENKGGRTTDQTRHRVFFGAVAVSALTCRHTGRA